MTRTTQDLAERALLELGRADAENPAESATDIQFVKETYDSLYLRLEEKAFWEKDAIDERVFVPLAQHVAFNARNAFGRPDFDPRDDKGLTPIQQIEAISMIETAGFPTVGQYY